MRKLLMAALAVSALLGLSVPGVAVADEVAAQPCQLGYDQTPPDRLHPAPFLKLPFRARDARNSVVPDNGWLMAEDEIPIAGDSPHRALDFVFQKTKDFGYGTTVVAPANGRAYYTYQSLVLPWEDPATGQTHMVDYGAGLVVEVRFANGFVAQLAHLRDVVSGIPYLRPTLDADGNWFPSGLLQPNEVLWELGVPVVAGQLLGHQGDTGIGFDWRDALDVETGTVAPRDRKQLRPWDPPQLHFQIYQGRVNGVKQNIIDPLGVYGQVRERFNPYGRPGNLCYGPQSAFVTDSRGHLLYAG